ncbi:hypothetical protein E0Z10_g7982 [Xylaria hypoxylon]|uniref:Uncharacterized protein n=1 Tax=Xylaria hypoxylon TaxID=37992 RepID=A0A4Z0YCJ2_9PEZI|nr:hypothetical protein E0Z10_g7982 [Xylaria hypoxylon]
MDRQFENSAVWTASAHNLDFAVREYLLLHNQHEELCQRLNQLSPTFSSSSPSSSSSLSSLSIASTAVTSPSVSPTRSFLGRDRFSPCRDQQMTSHTWTPRLGCRSRVDQRELVRDGSVVGEVAAGEQKLYDVNEGMKRALTELLNCEAVRQDKAMRTWVQTRLMETEKELRRGRRRRSSATVD